MFIVRHTQRSRRLSDRWAQRLMGIAAIGLVVVWLVTLWMAGEGGTAKGMVKFYEERDSLVIDQMRQEADRLDAAREAWSLCRKADTEEACK